MKKFSEINFNLNKSSLSKHNIYITVTAKKKCDKIYKYKKEKDIEK